jgi:hypothetical protein
MDIVHTTQTLFKEALNFIVYGVFIGYFARKFVAEWLLREGKKIITKTERNTAIWTHYQRQAIGKGHEPASVLDCSQEKCRVFGSAQLA